MRPRLLDLYSCAGGAAVGYQRAGFDVVGVDIARQPNYPFEHHVADAVEFVRAHGHEFDAIHASPPCQHYTTASATARKHHGADYPDLIDPTRDALAELNVPWVIENVPAARSRLRNPVKLCGSSFGLDLERHRFFEISGFDLMVPPCDHSWQTPRFRSLDARMVKAGRLARVVGVHGHCQYAGEFALRCAAMGIGWMTSDELAEAIPPAYTQLIGEALVAELTTRTMVA